MIKYIGFLFALFLTLLVSAQQPAYFRFAEQQFEGVDIYDVIQDKEHNYFFATDQGIFLHDGYTFKQIECSEMKGQSIFNFVINTQGVIYCHNLNQQVFAIKDQKCKLIYTLPESGEDVNLYCVASGELIINTSKNLYLLNSQHKLIDQTHYKASNGYISGPAFHEPSPPIFHRTGTKIFFKCIGGKFVKTSFLNGKNDKPFEANLNYFQYKKQTYFINIETGIISSYTDQNGFEPKGKFVWSKESEHCRMYALHNQIWIASSISGLYIKETFSSLFQLSEKLYADYFISDIFQDTEGNILLSTFDKGVLVIPSQSVTDVEPALENFEITCLAKANNKGVFFGTREGQIGKIDSDKQVKLLLEKGNKFNESLKTMDSIPLLFSDIFGLSIIHKKTGVINLVKKGSFKDVTSLDKTHFLIGTNVGVYELATDTDYKTFVVGKQLSNSRVYQLTNEKENKVIYVSSAEGVFSIMNDKKRLIQYKGQPINATYILADKGFTYIATRKNGLLIAKNGKITGKIPIHFKEDKVVIFKFLFVQDNIIANTEYGLKIFNRKGETIMNFDQANGLSSNKIIDFTYSDNRIWVTHSRGTQVLNLDKLKSSQFTPKIFIRKVYNNSIEIEIPIHTDQTFNPDEKNLKIEFHSPTLRYRQNILYHYKLLGSENEWNVTSYENNSVNYQSLSSGKYTFEVRAEYNGNFSKPAYYTFTILAPIYKQPWFIALVFFVLLGMVTLVYLRKLKSQRIEAEQLNALNASKLTAIQSQMNPHFIFNSLNSIQDLVLKGDVDNSYTFITKFSNLVRKTLNYSQMSFIEFEQEIQLLDLYLSLEKLRFKTDFSYSIDTHDIDEIMVPPMLIQPFVENALVHGLLHKEGEKKLHISFELKDVLICKIRDNGIGRDQAKEIKLRQRQSHESFSGNAIKRRFDILENHYKGELGFEYEDLYENDVATGTVVILRIPIQNRF